jgi:hypothetical protein
MATTIEQISEFLESEDLHFEVDENIIRTGFKTDNYRDSDGDEGVRIVIALEENGEFIKIVAPMVYKYPDGPHKAVLFQLLLMISWQTKMLQYEYDVTDGEVRAIIEFPLEDADLTKTQLMRCLRWIAKATDDHHGDIVAAMTKGELPKREESEEEDMAQLWDEFQQFLQQKRQQKGGDGHGLPS